MVLKDWRKERNYYFVRKENSNKVVHIFKNKLQKSKKWWVDISDYPFYEVTDFEKKTQAMRYAKAYMRKH